MVNARNKGARVERVIVKELNEADIPCERNLAQTRDGGHDIETEFHAIEVKGVETNLQSRWFTQATKQAYVIEKAPVLVHKRSRQVSDYWVLMGVDEFAAYEKMLKGL